MSRASIFAPLRHVRCFVPDDLRPITTVADDEEEPSAGGLERADVEAIWGQAERLFRRGLHPAIALCLRRRGHIVLHRTLGWSHGHTPDAPDPPGGARTVVTPQTPLCIFSASKAITAMVIHLLDERGLLHVDDPVIEYIPEFGQNGKRWITLRHLLTHRAGIPSTRGGGGLERLADWDGILRDLCAATPSSRPGERVAYHALTGGFVLGEVVRRVTGKDLRQVLREEILAPIGIARLNYGVPPADVPLVAESVFTGLPVFPPLTMVSEMVLGMGFEEAAVLSNEREFLEAIVPSGNIVGTAEELSRFYQLLLNGGEYGGVRVFEARTIRRATQRTTFRDLDLSLLLPMRYGLGFMLGGRWLSPFGPNTQAAFGHLGLMNIHCWADRWRDTAVGLITTGKPLVADHIPALWGLLTALGERCPRV